MNVEVAALIASIFVVIYNIRVAAVARAGRRPGPFI
jgi:hypothetical protein